MHIFHLAYYYSRELLGLVHKISEQSAAVLDIVRTNINVYDVIVSIVIHLNATRHDA